MTVRGTSQSSRSQIPTALQHKSAELGNITNTRNEHGFFNVIFENVK
jgi:hypothetical protein